MKKTSKLEGRSWFLNLYIKTAMWKVTLITFKSLKRGLVWSEKLEKFMILMAFFVIQKEVEKKFDKYYPKLLNNMLKMDIQEHSIGPVRFCC